MTDMITGTVRRGAVVLAMVVALAGCGGAKVTPIIIHTTPTPSASPVETPTAEASASAAASEAPSASAASSATPAATPTAAATPAAAGSGAGSVCSGTTPEMQSYFADAAAQLSFAVYCAVLPSSWWLSDTQYTAPNGGQMTIIYKNNSGGRITVGEGDFCAGAPLCWTSTSNLGAASFGPLSGTLKLRAAGQYAVYVDAGTTHGYQIIGQGLSQANFVAYAAAMVKVQKA